ncbi:MAG TPA: amidohydrolase [Firmicutes bacterium]|nr:amidohydrolase [Bacillota bacterium]
MVDGRIDVKAGLLEPKIDVHAHVLPGEEGLRQSDRLVAVADKLGITELWCSAPIAGGRMASPEEIRRNNDGVIAAMRRHPRRIRGLCFVIPGYYTEAIAEVERCLAAGMIGIKLYNQYKIHDPAVWPIIKLAAERRIPVLEHCAHLTGKTLAEQPLTSDGADMARISERFPDAILINAHIGGGGDLEWSLRALRDASPNLYVDVSGSNLEDGQIEMAVAELGASRVLFATDSTMEGCVGKVIGARLSRKEKEMIFRLNAADILAKQGLQPFYQTQAAGTINGEASADAV